MRRELVPTDEAIFGWISEITAQGIRRPAYPADRWTEEHCLRWFRELGMENARLEPFRVNRWEPNRWSLQAWNKGERASSAFDIACFPVPYTLPAHDVTAELVAFDGRGAARGNALFVHRELPRLPYEGFLTAATAWYDPEHTFRGYEQVLPFSTGRAEEIDAMIAAGASAFIGSVGAYPGDCCEQYAPYRGEALESSGVWVSGNSGLQVEEMLARGPVSIRLNVESEMRAAESNNVLGELPGADEELVVVGSHHDGPWMSAVEDASGVALVLAQAEYWSRVPREDCPHRMLFLLQGGHMAGGAGHKAFTALHSGEMERMVLSVHLEHAAAECVESEGVLRTTGRPEPRWWFTSRIPTLEKTVLEAIELERLARSVVLHPGVFGGHLPTDASGFNDARVPLVSFLSAPFYLFDSQDTLEKVDRENLSSLTRATIRIIESTCGQSAKSMREARVD